MNMQAKSNRVPFFDRVAASGLPALDVADEVGRLLREHRSVIVSAPPGAGKSTALPLTFLEHIPEGTKILMLEPRRLAARQIALRMASLLGESAGQTVGYRIRFEKAVSSRTRIEILTEGLLTRMLVSDPTLDGVSMLVFDEFHERSLSSDMALALAMEIQSEVRPDLKIVIMSATIETDSICAALDAPKVVSEGRMFPVEIIHTQTEVTAENAAEAVAHQIRIA
jgi:HrpA-like helicases